MADQTSLSTEPEITESLLSEKDRWKKINDTRLLGYILNAMGSGFFSAQQILSKIKNDDGITLSDMQEFLNYAASNGFFYRDSADRHCKFRNRFQIVD